MAKKKVRLERDFYTGRFVDPKKAKAEREKFDKFLGKLSKEKKPKLTFEPRGRRGGLSISGETRPRTVREGRPSSTGASWTGISGMSHIGKAGTFEKRKGLKGKKLRRAVAQTAEKRARGVASILAGRPAWGEHPYDRYERTQREKAKIKKTTKKIAGKIWRSLI